jgi:integrase
MPFDARAAKLLQPGEHITLQEHPGLRLVASTRGRSWIYRYKSPVDTGMRQVKLGAWPAMGYPQAVVAWEEKRDTRATGVDLQLEKKKLRRQALAAKAAVRSRAYTVHDLVQDYLTGHIDVRRKPKGRAEVRKVLEKHTASIADRSAEQLLRSEAYELLSGLSDRPDLMGKVRQEMGAAYDYGLDSGKLAENTPNWWRQVWRGKMPRTKGKRIAGEHTGGAKRVLTEKEIGLLINWLPNFSALVADILTLYLWTGTRGAEIVSMEKGEFTEEAGVLWWTIPKHKTKNARHISASDLRVPLIGRARAVAKRRVAAAAQRYLFPAVVVNEDGSEVHIEQKIVQGAVYHFQPYCKTKDRGNVIRPRLPVSHWAPHDLRRTVRTQLAVMGCPQEVAEAVLGHMQPGIVGVYNRHQYDAERLDWLKRLDARFEDLALAEVS